MHSEWAANMEQTTSMTHETALHITEYNSQEVCTDWHDDGNPEGWCGRKPQYNSNTTLYEKSIQTIFFFKWQNIQV